MMITPSERVAVVLWICVTDLAGSGSYPVSSFESCICNRTSLCEKGNNHNRHLMSVGWAPKMKSIGLFGFEKGGESGK